MSPIDYLAIAEVNYQQAIQPLVLPVACYLSIVDTNAIATRQLLAQLWHQLDEKSAVQCVKSFLKVLPSSARNYLDDLRNS